MTSISDKAEAEKAVVAKGHEQGAEDVASSPFDGISRYEEACKLFIYPIWPLRENLWKNGHLLFELVSAPPPKPRLSYPMSGLQK